MCSGDEAAAGAKMRAAKKTLHPVLDRQIPNCDKIPKG